MPLVLKVDSFLRNQSSGWLGQKGESLREAELTEPTASAKVWRSGVDMVHFCQGGEAKKSVVFGPPAAIFGDRTSNTFLRVSCVAQKIVLSAFGVTTKAGRGTRTPKVRETCISVECRERIELRTEARVDTTKQGCQSGREMRST